MQSLWPIFFTSMCQCSNKQEIGVTADVCPCAGKCTCTFSYCTCHIYVTIIYCLGVYRIVLFKIFVLKHYATCYFHITLNYYITLLQINYTLFAKKCIIKKCISLHHKCKENKSVFNYAWIIPFNYISVLSELNAWTADHAYNFAVCKIWKLQHLEPQNPQL